jgi:hypothetical protein
VQGEGDPSQTGGLYLTSGNRGGDEQAAEGYKPDAARRMMARIGD